MQSGFKHSEESVLISWAVDTFRALTALLEEALEGPHLLSSGGFNVLLHWSLLFVNSDLGAAADASRLLLKPWFYFDVTGSCFYLHNSHTSASTQLFSHTAKHHLSLQLLLHTVPLIILLKFDWRFPDIQEIPFLHSLGEFFECDSLGHLDPIKRRF